MTSAYAFKRIAKQALTSGLAKAVPPTWRRRRGELVILMYHRILPRDDPRFEHEQPGMVVTPDTLAMHLRVLAAHFHLVRLTDWAHGTAPSDRPCCAITFDDGWRDNYDFAYPLLRDAGVPATIFLVSDMIGTTEDFWPGRLTRLIEAVDRLGAWDAGETHWIRRLNTSLGENASARTPPEEIDRLIVAAKQATDAEIAQWIADTEKSLEIRAPEHPTPVLMNWPHVREMRDSGLIDFGSHTRRHTRLTDRVDAAALIDEIRGSADRIEAELGTRPDLFCYPNGDVCLQARQLVGETYHAAVTTAKGWNASTADRRLLRRIGVHEDIAATPSAFLARLSGWL